MDLAEQIKLIAFSEIRNETSESRLRHVYRWYSKTFATPLHLVPSLPFVDILTAFFEEQFENMSTEEMEDERKILIETEGQRLARIVEAESNRNSDSDFHKAIEEQAKKLETTTLPKQETIRPVASLKIKELPEAKLPDPEPIPPDVTVKFVDDKFFDDLMERIDSED